MSKFEAKDGCTTPTHGDHCGRGFKDCQGRSCKRYTAPMAERKAKASVFELEEMYRQETELLAKIAKAEQAAGIPPAAPLRAGPVTVQADAKIKEALLTVLAEGVLKLEGLRELAKTFGVPFEDDTKKSELTDLITAKL